MASIIKANLILSERKRDGSVGLCYCTYVIFRNLINIIISPMTYSVILKKEKRFRETSTEYSVYTQKINMILEGNIIL